MLKVEGITTTGRIATAKGCMWLIVFVFRHIRQRDELSSIISEFNIHNEQSEFMTVSLK